MDKIESEAQYRELIGRDTYTVVKYYASWCPDCRNLDRFIGGIIAEHSDKSWVELDTEQFPDIAEENEVRGIPSLLVYRNGRKIAHLHSKFAKTPEQVREYLDSLAEA